MSEQQTAWPIKEVTQEYKRLVLPTKRYLSQLASIRLSEVFIWKNGVKTNEKEFKLFFTFKPYGIACPEDTDCDIYTAVRPTKGERGHMRKLLKEMSEDGAIPASAEISNEAWQAYAESFIGKWFNVASEPNKSNSSNIAMQVVPAEPPKNYVAPSTEPDPTPKGETGFESTPDAEKHTLYDIVPIQDKEDKVRKFLEIITTVKYVVYEGRYYDTFAQEFPTLLRLKVPADKANIILDDQIPF